MQIKKILLQNFRSYNMEKYEFEDLTFVIGNNATGKSNLLEAINMISTGKSYHADKEEEVIRFNYEFARIKARVEKEGDRIILEVLLKKEDSLRVSKKYLVNDVSKTRRNFASNFQTLIFVPQDLDIIIGSPSVRRRYLDSALYATDIKYRAASISYEKALRQRNALLKKLRDTGVRKIDEFEYWNKLLIDNGDIITQSRESFVDYIEKTDKKLIGFQIEYDKSTISKERLHSYSQAEEALGVTLVGPHRDDLKIYIGSHRNTKSYGSRGQQRLVVLQMKLLELEFMSERLSMRPVLLLDDIFSELDDNHILEVMKVIDKQQTIIATTHEEFVPKKLLDAGIIRL